MNRCFTHILADPKYSFENLQSCFLTRGAFGKNSSGVEENQKYQRHWAQYHYSRKSDDLICEAKRYREAYPISIDYLIETNPHD